MESRGDRAAARGDHAAGPGAGGNVEARGDGAPRDGLLRRGSKRMKPLKIAYLMEDTELSGGQRVQLVHADALIARGHRVRIVTKGLPVTWRRSRAEWVYVD